jgi:predicted negative regulator of RcsB-dependent stress response
VDEAIAISEANGERFYAAELWRIRGEILAAAGRDADARSDYEKALVLIAQKRQDRLGKPIEDLKRRLELALATTDHGGTRK